MKKYFYTAVLVLVLLISGCDNTGGSDSPSNSLKDFVLALKEQNPGKAWNFLSSNSQKMYDDIARNRNQSGKEYFEKSVSNVSSLGLIGMDFEVVDEKKDGDNAVVTIKSKDNSTSEYFSVRESGVWKLDYAKTIEENMKKVE
ncbi:MAG: DUF4878 domain-containing protein [Bacteroidetes bacterium]|nr:DUF4878 domain-containing protein [Bacteroidota bacterium]